MGTEQLERPIINPSPVPLFFFSSDQRYANLVGLYFDALVSRIIDRS